MPMDGLDAAPPEASDVLTDAGLHSLAGSGSILSRTARGAGWIIGWRMTTRLLGMFSTLILVRLLTPSDFGLVALVMSFLQGINSLSEVGVSEAIIRADRPDRSVYDAGFTINIIRSLSTSLIMVAAAVPIAHFFHNAHLVNVTLVLSAMFALSGFENIGQIDFWRFLAFDKEFKIKILPRLLSITVAISAAFIWHSYWALVAAIFSSQIAALILSYTMHPYRPRISFAGMPAIASFSFWMWVNSLIGLVGGRVTTVYIGRLIGVAGLGIFGVGNEVATLASAEIVGPLCRALFSSFASAKRTGDSGAETMLRVLALMSLVTFPLSVGISLVAYPVIKLAFGPEWLGAVPIVEIMGVATTLTLFGSVSGMLFAAHSQVKTMVWMNVVSAVVRVVLVMALVPLYGLMGAALAMAGMDVAQQILYLVMAVRRLNVSLLLIVLRSLRPVVAGAVMTLVLVKTNLGWTVSAWQGGAMQTGMRLAEAVSLGGAVYVASVLLLWLASGRPQGGETDALLTAKRMLKLG